MLCQLSSSLIGSSKLDEPKLNRLTKSEQAQYDIPEKLGEILVGLILGDLWANKRVCQPVDTTLLYPLVSIRKHQIAVFTRSLS